MFGTQGRHALFILLPCETSEGRFGSGKSDGLHHRQPEAALAYGLVGPLQEGKFVRIKRIGLPLSWPV